MKLSTVPQKIDGIPIQVIVSLDWDLYPNGVGHDKFCPRHGRHGDGEGPCICDRWWKCPSCGGVSWGSHCGGCGHDYSEHIGYDTEEFESLPNIYRRAWQKWMNGRPYLHEVQVTSEDFQVISDGRPFDIRHNSEGFLVGDVLEYQDGTRRLRRIVTHTLTDREVTKRKNDHYKGCSDENFQQAVSWIENFPWKTVILGLAKPPAVM